MPAIAADEVSAGIVVFLDTAVLRARRDLVWTGTGRDTVDSRLFVCTDLAGDSSEWSPLTTTYRRERLFVDRTWRGGGDPDCSGGWPQWQLAEQYLQDGASTVTGPNEAFVAASHLECTTPATRSRVSNDGLAAIREEMRVQTHRR